MEIPKRRDTIVFERIIPVGMSKDPESPTLNDQKNAWLKAIAAAGLIIEIEKTAISSAGANNYLLEMLEVTYFIIGSNEI